MSCTPAITTVSLGRPGLHGMEAKLRAAADNGITSIELFFEDIEALAGNPPLEPHASRAKALLDAVIVTRDLCRKLAITILNLQPLRFYEGLVDRDETERMQRDEIPLWLDMMGVLGTDTLLVASNFLGPDPDTGAPRTTGSRSALEADIRFLADAAAQRSPPIRIAYEAIAWADHVFLWEQAWDLVRAVNRPNMGIVLDTFNMACAAYADPCTSSGTLSDNPSVAAMTLGASLRRLARDVDFSRVFAVQVADGERLDKPLLPGHPFHVAGQPARMSWSRNARLFLCEPYRGGYLPILDIVRCLVGCGWRGPMAFEVFSRTLADPAASAPAHHARRAAQSWDAMCATLSLRSLEPPVRQDHDAKLAEPMHVPMDSGRSKLFQGILGLMFS
ncbi:4-hydroxyphenylpyruvate dioxygenase [Geosmithia morbida]|uniref:4-hydroxyphenylpyruvate dioxygenase n=1 Tax=Geosmithia morbida TaxID=1094350 RepID=A0A9P4Z0E8_9HYPO|nr:4-hydroxyphenylpyruvate dioxygenase [Geosmithia morbida]KAF4125395.1 4-hydroxyphenylpyruvate dioxygenase [Geosmithia morbida]